MSINKSIINNFSVYHDDFTKHYDEIKTEAVGWNGRQINVIPLYQLHKLNIVQKMDLSNLKPYDIVQFEENRCFNCYLVIPLKVKNIFKVDLDNMDELFKKFILNYCLIEFEYDCSDEVAFVPPEGIEAIEEYDIHYFDNILEIEDVHGIILDKFFIMNNKQEFVNNLEIIGDDDNYDKILFLWISSKHKLGLNDANDNQIKTMKNSNIIIDESIIKTFITNDSLLESIIKDLPDKRGENYPNSFDLYEDTNTIIKNDSSKKNNVVKAKQKTTSLKSKKKDELIEIVQEKEKEIDELKKNIYHLTNDLNNITTQYKELKEKNIDNERDSNYLNKNVSKGITNIKQLLSKLDSEINKINIQW